jgi:LCP family protein required for cell wall assembly
VPTHLPPPTPHPDDVEIHTVPRFGAGRPAGPAGPDGRQRKRRRRTRRRLIIAALSLIGIVILGVGGIFLYAQWRFSQLKKVSVAGLAPRNGNDPFNILLVGSDSRAFVSDAAQAARFGSAAATTGQRSDVIIIARVVPLLHQVKLLSIPRDTYVNIPGSSSISGPNRINAAFDSGPDVLIKTIKQSFGIPINDYAEIGFPGFSGMVDALGGIWLNFPDPVHDAFSGLHITTTGCQLVKGGQALALVRSRHLFYESNGTWYSDGNSDWSRIQRQDAFFQALIPKLRGVSTSPTGINSLLGAMTGDVTIDRSLTAGTLLSLAKDFHSSNGSPLTSETLPTIPFTTAGGAAVLLPASGPDESVISSFLAFGTTTTSTTAFATPGGSVDAQLMAATSPSITVTTIPSNVNPNDVILNNVPEPWNPKPCTP